MPTRNSYYNKIQKNYIFKFLSQLEVARLHWLKK